MRGNLFRFKYFLICFLALASIASYNQGQKCWEGSFILQITPLPVINVGFVMEKKGDFSCLKNSNIEYGGGGGGGHISQILQPIVRTIEYGVK